METIKQDPYGALRQRDFRLLIVGRFISSLGGQMLFFAISWEMWLRTRDAFVLGLVGLVQVIPIILISLPAGHVADQFNRRRIVLLTQLVFTICSLSLAAVSTFQWPLVWVFVILFVFGLARAFNETASSTLLPESVPPHLFGNAATWSSSAWQTASIVGPALAGGVIAMVGQVTWIYIADAVAALAFVLLVTQMQGKPLPLSKKTETWASLKEGMRFLRETKVLLAAITLDMFAVMFGGAVALMPVYATDVLNVGPEWLGVMRAAPSIGAITVTFLLAHLPPFRKTGVTLLWAVSGYGLATIVFGVSSNIWLSITMLGILGGLDNISVVIRSTMMLTQVPDEMRGRASAINAIFIGGSNELGQFESGVVASILGPVGAVVAGGIGTLLVVLGVAKAWPDLIKLGRLDLRDPKDHHTEANSEMASQQ